MAEIIPAIMPQNVRDLEAKVTRVASAVHMVQLDIMDGAFVHEKTWPYIKPDLYFEEMIKQDRGLPLWDEVDYEIDLMIKDPLEQAQNWINAGAARIIAHIESFKNEQEIKDFVALKNEFLEVGLAIGVDTPISKLEPYLNDISCVQCMGIKRIGYQGEPLDPRVYTVIKTIREKAPELSISVDGGVSFETAHELIEAGATHLVSGSTVFDAINPHEAIRDLGKA